MLYFDFIWLNVNITLLVYITVNRGELELFGWAWVTQANRSWILIP